MHLLQQTVVKIHMLVINTKINETKIVNEIEIKPFFDNIMVQSSPFDVKYKQF